MHESSTHFLQRFLLALWRFLLVTRSSCTIKDFSAFLGMKSSKNWAHKISSWKHLSTWRPILPIFLPSPECLIAALYPELLSGVLGKKKMSSCSSTDLILQEVDGNCQWQVLICSGHCSKPYAEAELGGAACPSCECMAPSDHPFCESGGQLQKRGDIFTT